MLPRSLTMPTSTSCGGEISPANCTSLHRTAAALEPGENPSSDVMGASVPEKLTGPLKCRGARQGANDPEDCDEYSDHKIGGACNHRERRRGDLATGGSVSDSPPPLRKGDMALGRSQSEAAATRSGWVRLEFSRDQP